VVLEASETPGILATDIHADGKYSDILCVPGHVSGGAILGDPVLKMDGQAVFKLAVGVLEETARASLAKAGLNDADIDWLIPHQANLRIAQFIQQKLGLREDQVYNNIMRYGNTTAASIPIALSEAFDEGRIQKGDLIMMAAFGSGFTWGSALMRW
ncbi:MAG: 3-oxoacyl-[acyl-carrier-protein] synthase 3 protein 1, partial [Bacteroidota bacterium]